MESGGDNIMPILRAGPFAEFGDPFLNEPASPSPSLFPVNCAIDYGASAWPWRYYRRDNVGSAITLETIESAPTTTNASGASFYEGTKVWFAYQAVNDVPFNFSYNATAEGTGFSSCQLGLFINGSFVFQDTDFQSGSSNVSGSTTITLPASVVPIRVRLVVDVSGNGTNSWSFTFEP